MKILLTHRYFWPDTPPYAALLRVIAAHLADQGHTVEVFASQPSYGRREQAPRSERLDGFAIRRVRTLREAKGNLPARVFNTLIYCAVLWIHIVRRRPDVVTAATFPPVAAGWTASLAAKIAGAAFVYHMQDVHPEVSRQANGLLGRGLPFRVLRWLDNQTLRRSDAIVVLSQDMSDTVTTRMPRRRLPIHVINNFALQNFTPDAKPPSALVKSPNRKRAIFAGNLGRFQNLPLLVEGVARCFASHPELELLLLGDGEMKARLEREWGDHPQVVFGPFLPFAQAEPLIRDADVGLVSLAPGISSVSYPSKVLTYIGLGLPMLALVEPHSALAREIRENGLGAVPDAPTAGSIASALEQMLDRDESRAPVELHHREVTRPEAVLKRWSELFAGGFTSRRPSGRGPSDS